MIQTKILDLKGYKKIEDIVKDLDNLANYEGFIIQCCAGKKNNLIILQRVFNYQQPMTQMETPSQIVSSKSRGKKSSQGKDVMFPNAVYQ